MDKVSAFAQNDAGASLQKIATTLDTKDTNALTAALKSQSDLFTGDAAIKAIESKVVETQKAVGDVIAADAAAKAAAEKAAADAKAAADKAAADAKAAADKLAADQKAAADKIIADKAAADKATEDKIIADKAAADKIIADKAAADAKAAYDAQVAANTPITKILDDLSGSFQNPAPLNAADGNGLFIFSDSIVKASFTRIINFGANDKIKFSDFSNIGLNHLVFESYGTDVVMTVNMGSSGIASQITLVGVNSNSGLITDITTFNNLTVGDVSTV
jgi:pyruvate/2-oxoglutarate dehydrogenase complex dihydrolipoamide acyltransferase (E2) component